MYKFHEFWSQFFNDEKASGFNVNVKNEPRSIFNPGKYSSLHPLIPTLINAMNGKQL